MPIRSSILTCSRVMLSTRRLGRTALLVLLLVLGCDSTVDRFQENEMHYSVFGYLDAAANANVVRVEPLRDGMLRRAPDTLDAEVTLTNLSTGETTALRDSLSPRLSVHNYYTSADIDPGTSYRLTVEGPGDAATFAETTVPAAFPTPTVTDPARLDDPFSNGRTGVRVEGVERLATVKALYYLVNPPNVTSIVDVSEVVHVSDTFRPNEESIDVDFSHREDFDRINSQAWEIVRIEVVVAAAGPDWPEFAELDLEMEAQPDIASNVEGGVGLFGGVVSDTVVVYPFESN